MDRTGRRAAAGPDRRFREIDDSGGPKAYPCHRVVGAKGNEGKNGRARACLISRRYRASSRTSRRGATRTRRSCVHEATYFRVRLHDKRLRSARRRKKRERERTSLRRGSDLSQDVVLECPCSRNSLNIFRFFERPLLEIPFFLNHFSFCARKGRSMEKFNVTFSDLICVPLDTPVKTEITAFKSHFSDFESYHLAASLSILGEQVEWENLRESISKLRKLFADFSQVQKKKEMNK